MLCFIKAFPRQRSNMVDVLGLHIEVFENGILKRGGYHDFLRPYRFGGNLRILKFMFS